ncbi:GNAT family N-acetyltransferase [Cellulomonas septica]|uniref:Lysine N-acyltransferase MbtK n=1 Tax=Cellulomonas septica TaxID=285080 RepID=A0ABX1K4D1_9CELL|nr:GNAT family N-acetyltransferase [Cellulomonas septica]NKY40415.1 acetyltransferase [Cellulomonas septica]
MTTAPTTGARLRSGPRGTVVDERDVPGLGVLTTTVLDPDGDLDTVHAWVTQPHTGFWGLGGLSRTGLRDTYAFVDGLPTHHAFLLRRDGLPVALLQTYEPEHDPVGEAYDVQPGDVGLHFLLGARGRPTPRFSTLLMGAALDALFEPPAARRVVIEPDARNDRAVSRAVRQGFVLGPVVDLPTKRAQLASLTRERWTEVRPTTAGA